MNTYKLTPESLQKEKNTVQQILVNNNYEASTMEKFSKKRKQGKERDTQKGKWAKFTYVGRKRDLLQNCSRILMLKSRSLRTTQLKDCWLRNRGPTKTNTIKVGYTN
jgi:hypothetical protein